MASIKAAQGPEGNASKLEVIEFLSIFIKTLRGHNGSIQLEHDRSANGSVLSIKTADFVEPKAEAAKPEKPIKPAS